MITQTAFNMPFLELLPRLEGKDYEELKADIQKRGVVVPVILDENNNILDGNHRILIAQELGILSSVKFEVRPGLDETEKWYLAYDLNLHRRHLTTDQRAKIAIQLRQDGLSYPQIAEKLGVDHATVISDIKKSGCEFPQPQKVIGKDGKTYPAKKRKFESSQTSIFTVGANGAAKIVDTLQSINTEQLPNKPLTQKRFERIAREAQANQRRQEKIEQPGPNLPANIDIRLGDFVEILNDVPDNSIDLIFTDPPYLGEYLPLWLELSKLAQRVLKPGKLLIAYSGQYHLLKAMNHLAEYLEYFWLGSLKLNGPHNIIRQKQIYNDAKPLLFFSKNEYQPTNFFSDFIENDKPEKDNHDWQQGIAPATYYLEKLTGPGNTILDPFLGSGTTAEAAHKLQLNFIGCDIDPNAIILTQERFTNGKF